ncbi:uncharacterized protein LOC121982403 isoform X2 [Zingiber officinale]|uniref:uncharacterized protein LOC121982399 isoform X2 n=1 Tax=Zingiber officinale TaxID=94328 RepID=UPI001C4AD731|nr:uncharacterized protein LOC121982399 isoform X2 [Zingiber officinale]XP_042391377.1 uncharacterized protein LOC121982403 isoform X2 [Zingiber officinale]
MKVEVWPIPSPSLCGEKPEEWHVMDPVEGSMIYCWAFDSLAEKSCLVVQHIIIMTFRFPQGYNIAKMLYVGCHCRSASTRLYRCHNRLQSIQASLNRHSDGLLKGSFSSRSSNPLPLLHRMSSQEEIDTHTPLVC